MSLFSHVQIPPPFIFKLFDHVPATWLVDIPTSMAGLDAWNVLSFTDLFFYSSALLRRTNTFKTPPQSACMFTLPTSATTIALLTDRVSVVSCDLI